MCFGLLFSVVKLPSFLQLSGKEAPDIHCRDSVGNTPLHCAAYRGQKQCMIRLLKSGASPSIKNNSGLYRLTLNIISNYSGYSILILLH